METTPTLLALLQTHYPDSSISSLRSWIKLGRVLVNGEVIKKPGDHCSSDASIELLSQTATQHRKFAGMRILYEDNRLVAIDKPAGMLSVPAAGKESHALGFLKRYLNTPHLYPVHRIDKGTSGIMIFAKGIDSERKFDTVFEQHDIVREYIAVTEGNVEKDEGTFSCYIKEQSLYKMSLTRYPKDGKLAVSHYKTVKRSDNFSYLLFSLETGRKHQIRVHCQAMGHPIIGDRLYGAYGSPMKRIALHALRLSFTHPFTHKILDLYSSIPAAFKKLGFPDL
ncbi:MAG: RluA family pseudouridine synthase [Victivallaceae bacterium]